MGLSGKQIDALGERLRSGGAKDDDLELLNQLIADHATPLHDAVSRIQRLALPVLDLAFRLKTRGTLIDKLKRERGMALRRMQDIAGVRLVISGGLPEQDLVTAKLASVFEGARVSDRRAKPSFGYRAVHVVTRIDHRWVEVQVRTKWQNNWAQLLEQLAFSWGRQIRYGDAPIPTGNPTEDAARRRTLEDVTELSGVIERWEQGLLPWMPEKALDTLLMDLGKVTVSR